MLLVGRATECRQRIIVHWGVAIAVCPRMGGSDGGSACGHAFGANLAVWTVRGDETDDLG